MGLGNTWGRQRGIRGKGQGRGAAEVEWAAKPFRGITSSRKSGVGWVEHALLVLEHHCDDLGRGPYTPLD